MPDTIQPAGRRNFYCILAVPSHTASVIRFDLLASTYAAYKKTKSTNPNAFIMRSPEFVESIAKSVYYPSEISAEGNARLGVINAHVYAGNRKVSFDYMVSLPAAFFSKGISTLILHGLVKYVKNLENGKYRQFGFSGFKTAAITSKESETIEARFKESAEALLKMRGQFRAKKEFTTQNHPEKEARR